MPFFHCKTINKKGKAGDFIKEAISEEILIRELNQEEIFPLEVKEVQEYGPVSRKRRFSRNSVIEFTNTISLMLSSGQTFKDSLEIAKTIFLKGEVSTIINILLEEINKGKSVHSAVENLGPGLPPIFKGFIKIGEKTGSLEGAFKRLSEYMTEEKKLRDKLTGSLIYPVLVLGVSALGIFGIITFVLPRIREMFIQLGANLPQRLESMIHLINVIVIIGIALAASAVVGIFALFIIKKSNAAINEKLDRVILKLPVIGKIKHLKETLNLLFAIETLTGSGFTVEDALFETSSVVQNLAFRSGLLQARERILKGYNLSGAFIGNPVFSDRFSRWIAIGEKSGEIVRVFGQLRRYYQGETEKWSLHFMNLIEPIIILIVGIIIFLVIIFVVTPIFSVYEGLL